MLISYYISWITPEKVKVEAGKIISNSTEFMTFFTGNQNLTNIEREGGSSVVFISSRDESGARKKFIMYSRGV